MLSTDIPPSPNPLSLHGPEMGWQRLGSLESLYVRVAKEPAPRSVASVRAVAGHGLAGDRHASPSSPRQLLLAGGPAYRRWGLSPMALGENLRVDFATTQLDSGDLLRVGTDVVLWMTFVCEPCGRLERRCPGTLKAIGADRGMLARVVHGGEVREGDAVAVARARAPAFSNDWQERVLQAARAVPEGCRISYRQLAEMAGVQTAYCRAFPRVLSRLPAAVASRVASAAQAGSSPEWTGAELFDLQAPRQPSR